MKTLKLILPAVFLISLLLTGCGEDTPVTNSGGPNNSDTAFSSYVIITPAGGTSDTVYFTDRNLCRGSYSSSQNNTYCLLNDTISGNSSSVTFTGNSTGTPAFTFGYISYNGTGLNAVTVNGTVSLYGDIGGKIKGTFTGSYSDGTITYQCTGEFTVIRTI